MKWFRHPEHGVMQVFESMTEAVCRRAGWEEFDPVAAPPPPSPEPAPEAQDIAEMLEQAIEPLREQARAAGIRVDLRWGMARLRREIEDHQRSEGEHDV